MGKFVNKKTLSITALVLTLATVGSLIHTEPSYAACPTGQTAGIAGTPQNDPKKCYLPGNNTPQSDNTDPNATSANPTSSSKDNQGSNANDTTCAIDKIGWMLCPLIEKSGQVGDQAFQLLSKNFLETEPELVARFNGNGKAPSGTYTVWELARNIANIMFIAAFLIVILSQVTGRGLDNYGIKKTLPRLIIAAVAVNVSYYICQLMVDLTNVLGYEIENFMVHTAAQVSDQSVLPINTGFTSTKTDGGALGTMAGWIVSTAAVVWFLLPVLFLGVSTVVITCLVIIAILLMRKAFIILLVVVSPIAFVLYLLPNTEKYFQKWMSMFWKLLLVFPTVSLLFGAGQLASAIVLVAGTNKTTDIASTSSTTQSSYSDTSGKCIELPKSVPTTSSKSGDSNGNPASIKDCGAGSTPVMLGLVAAGIAIAPLLAVWSVLKGALSAAGAIGGKIGGAIQSGGAGLNKYTRKPEDAFRKGLFNAYKARALRGDKVGIGGRTTRFIQRRKMAGERRENELKAAEAGFALHDPRAGKISEQNINAQQQANAAHIAEMQKYARSGLAGSDNYLGAAGSDAAVVSALASQKKRASEELIKAYNEALSTTDIADKPGQAGLQSQLRQAFIDRNDDLVKAIVDELSKSSRGRKAIRAETAGFEEGSHYDTVVRQRIQTNSPGAKNSDAALKNWVDGGGGTYGSNWDSQATWQAKVDNLEKFVAMDGDAQNQAWSQFSREHRGMLKKAMDASPESLSRVDLALKEKDVWNDHT